MATDIEVLNHIVVPCCMKDRTFGRYVNEAREKKRYVLARTSGDVTVKHYLEYLVDYTPGCTALYVALPKLNRDVIYQLCDLMRMDYRGDGGRLVKRVPKLYLFTRGDEESGNVLMCELAESALSAFGERAVVVRMEDMSQCVVAMEHPVCPVTVLGTIPIKAARKSQLHVVTIFGDLVLTQWATKALRVSAKVR